MKKLICLLLALVMAIGMCSVTAFAEEHLSAFDLVIKACEENNSLTVDELDELYGEVTPESLSKSYKIAAVVKSLEGEHWQEVARGYEDAARELGITIDIFGGETESDITGQAATVEALVAKDYDAFILSPITESNLDNAIEMIVEKEIPIVNCDFEIINRDYPYIHCVGMTDFTPQGEWVAQWFAENLPEGSKVAHIEGLGGAIAAAQRKDGFVGMVESQGKLELVSSQPGDWDRETAYNITTNLLNMYPDLAGIYCANDGMAMGAVEAAVAMGSDVKIFGTDGIPEAVNAIKSGTMTGTVSSFGYYMGIESVKACLRLLEGKELPRLIVTDCSILTEDNVFSYYPD